jgi:TetR/AcrR family transcriptional regulator
MVSKSTTVKEGVTVKQEQIVEAAIRRFTHFGIQKTNLSEIAVDLGISKPALFYYYPDKDALVAAVEERIIREYIEAVEQQFTGTDTVKEALLKLLEVRMVYFEKYFMLASRLERTDPAVVNCRIDQVKQTLRDHEVALLARLLERGIVSGEVKHLDAAKTADLLLDTISALAQHCVRDRSLPPDHETVKDVHQKQKEVLKLFYNGLKQ